MRRPANWVKIYILTLLLLYVLGALESRVDSEGMGFLPLLAFTTPWSWPLTDTWDYSIWGGGLLGRYLAIFVTCNVISGAANSYILYLLIRWRQKRASRHGSRS